MVLDSKGARLLMYEFELQDAGMFRPDMRTAKQKLQHLLKQLNKTLLDVSLASPDSAANRRSLERLGVAMGSPSSTHTRWEVSADGLSG